MCIDKHWQTEVLALTDRMEKCRASAFRLSRHDKGFAVAKSHYEMRCADLVMHVRDTFGSTAFFVNFLKQELRDSTPDKSSSKYFIDRFNWDVKTDLTLIGHARSIGLVFKNSFLEAQSQIAAAQAHGITSFVRPLLPA